MPVTNSVCHDVTVSCWLHAHDGPKQLAGLQQHMLRQDNKQAAQPSLQLDSRIVLSTLTTVC